MQVKGKFDIWSETFFLRAAHTIDDAYTAARQLSYVFGKVTVIRDQEVPLGVFENGEFQPSQLQ